MRWRWCARASRCRTRSWTRGRIGWRGCWWRRGVGAGVGGGGVRCRGRWSWWWRCWRCVKAGGGVSAGRPGVPGRADRVHAGRCRAGRGADADRVRRAAGRVVPVCSMIRRWRRGRRWTARSVGCRWSGRCAGASGVCDLHVGVDGAAEGCGGDARGAGEPGWRGCRRGIGLGAGTGCCSTTPFGFDVSVWELFWPLVSGAALVVARPGGAPGSGVPGGADPGAAGDGGALRAVAAGRCSWRCRRRRSCRGCGRWCAAVRRCRRRWRAGSRRCCRRWLHNLYGPTEATVDVTAWPCVAGGWAVVGADRRVRCANTRVYVLDARLRPVPAGCGG